MEADQHIPLTHSFRLLRLDDHFEKSSMTRGPEQAARAAFVPTKSAKNFGICIVKLSQVSTQRPSTLQKPNEEAATS